MDFLALIPVDIVITVCMCFLACLSVAILMRFFVKPIFLKLDEFIKGKVTIDKLDKSKAIYATAKALILTVIACILTLIALDKLMKICVFPADNNRALMFFYFIPMLAVQFFLDAHMKKLACKVFGLPYEEEEKEDEEKPVKVKKYKVGGDYYVKDADGNLVPYTEE